MKLRTLFITLTSCIFLFSTFALAKDEASRVRGISAEERKRELGYSRRNKGRGKMGGGYMGGSGKGGYNVEETGSVCETCGKKAFINIHLEGSSFFNEVTPAFDFDENPTKVGSTITIKEEGLQGTAEYYHDYHSDAFASADIEAKVTGSCTILSTNSITPNTIDTCDLHCTFCVTYFGDDCVLGYATLTGDLILDVLLDEFGKIYDTFEQLTDYYGTAAVTGGAFDLAGYTNGAMGFVEYLGYVGDEPSYTLKLGVPFDDDTACKFSSQAEEQVFGIIV